MEARSKPMAAPVPGRHGLPDRLRNVPLPWTTGQAGWEAKKEAERRKRQAEKRWAEIESGDRRPGRQAPLRRHRPLQSRRLFGFRGRRRLGREKQDLEGSIAALYRELESLEAEGYGK